MLTLTIMVSDQSGEWTKQENRDIYPTLRSQMKHHEPILVITKHAEDTDNSKRSGGAIMNWNYDEIASTLRSQTKHHEPIVVIYENDRNHEDADREEVL